MTFEEAKGPLKSVNTDGADSQKCDDSNPASGCGGGKVPKMNVVTFEHGGEVFAILQTDERKDLVVVQMDRSGNDDLIVFQTCIHQFVPMCQSL